MNDLFIKKGDLRLINGGYAVVGENDTPIANEEFYKVQKNAEWVITFAKLAKGKDFVGKESYSLELLKDQVINELKEKDTKYIDLPSAPLSPLNTKLKKEALAFVSHNNKIIDTNKINKFLQKFNIIHEFEEFGLFFKPSIMKLNKIYTIKDITIAVESVINLL